MTAYTGFGLADLYAEDYRPAQEAIKAAGCHPRGKFGSPRRTGSGDG